MTRLADRPFELRAGLARAGRDLIQAHPSLSLVSYVVRTRRDVQTAAEQVPPAATEEREALALGLTPATEFDP